MNTIMAKRSISNSVDGGGIAALVKQSKVVPREKLIALTVAAQEGDEDAMRQVIDACSRLVLSISSRLWMQWSIQIPESASFDDIFQAGLEGLYVAVMKFDESRGNTLTTVATPWIHTRAQRTIYTLIGICHIPERLITGHDEDISHLLRRCTASLDMSVLDDAESMVHRLMGSEDDPQCGADDILRALAAADERLPAMITLSSEGYTDGEIGEMFGVTYERIRQMRGKAARALEAAGLV